MKNTSNVKFNQLKITLRDIDFSLNDKYDNEHLKFLLGVVSAYAIGVSIDIQERSDYFTIEIGKLSYSLNDWDIDISQPDKFNPLSLILVLNFCDVLFIKSKI